MSKLPFITDEQPRPLDEAQRGAISRGYCPDCSHPGFKLGPRGGAAVNLQCMNTKCGERFNVVAVSGFIAFAHRIQKDAEWPTEVHAINVVQSIIALLPNDRIDGLNILDAAKRMVERFKR